MDQTWSSTTSSENKHEFEIEDDNLKIFTDKSTDKNDNDKNELVSIKSDTRKKPFNFDDWSGSFREEALEEKCGVFGVISNGEWPTSLDVAHIIHLGLVGLQHRGQESAGIVTCKYKTEAFNVARSEGLVSSAFNEMSMMKLKGNLGIGHTRYSTSGGSGSIQLAQPFMVHTSYGTIAVAHNGELVNSSKLRETLLSRGVGLTTGGDSELITQCLSQTPPDEFRHPKILRKLRQRQQQSQQQLNQNQSQQQQQQQQQQQIVDYGIAESEVQAGFIVHNTPSQQGNQSNGTMKARWQADSSFEEDNITSRLLYLMSLTPLSYSLVIMYNECLYATRDSFGNRPLTIGMLVPPPNVGDQDSLPFSVIHNCYVEGWCISSESCPFPSVHARLMRDVEPGEIIKFERNKPPKTLAYMSRPPEFKSPSFCIFEYVYFARPDSIMENQTVYTIRKRCGERLADESPAFHNEDDRKNFIVAPVPESSIPAALGFSQRSNIPYVEVFCKNRYVGRTFIQPSTRLRKLGVAKKFGPLTENFQGKSIILIDDSIVRGTTIGQLVRLLLEAGAKEVHIRIASPPLHYPCHMGINIPTKEELIANHLTPEQLAITLGAASLVHLSVEGLREAVQLGIRGQIKAEKDSIPMPRVGNNDMGFQNRNNRNNRNLFDDYSHIGGHRSRRNSAGVQALNASLNNKTGSTNDATNVAASSSQNSNNNNNTSTSKPESGNNNGSCQAPSNVYVDYRDSEGRFFKDELEEMNFKVGHCDACLTGHYPVELDDE